jgi:hypothetical protein
LRTCATAITWSAAPGLLLDRGKQSYNSGRKEAPAGRLLAEEGLLLKIESGINCAQGFGLWEIQKV